MDQVILVVYFVALSILTFFALHGFIMIYFRNKSKDVQFKALDKPLEDKVVTIQLPMYNEMYVVERLIDSVCELDWPKDKLEIQILDDSTDETTQIVAKKVEEKKAQGFDIVHIRRNNREGFKAGALKYGLQFAKGEFVAIFDADFVPRPDFLKQTMKYFSDDKVGLVQTRWEHMNYDYSLLTKVQSFSLDGHFVIEQHVRSKAGFLMNFNGTGGVWRKECIIDAGNWEADTLTEDLDLSYRAQLKGWKFVYLRDVTTPAELPAEMNALKAQQFRWTKGTVEVSKKLLPMVWKSHLPLKTKIVSTYHLIGSYAFPFILLSTILNVPLVFIKNSGYHEDFFNAMSIFILGFLSTFFLYFFAQKDVHEDWQNKIILYPLFMAGSMGFALNNSRAVFEALLDRKSEFVRTPKFKIEGKKDKWVDKKYKAKINFSVYIELLMAIYTFVGLVAAIYFMELAAIPFHLLSFLGYTFVSVGSLKHALANKK
jgi:cellulose synthase/poly-beta-1,6-N-acetylglucosamine synthase-like glycosyltransferase